MGTGEVSQYFLCSTCVAPPVFLQYLPAQSLCIKVEIKCLPRVGIVCQYLALSYQMLPCLAFATILLINGPFLQSRKKNISHSKCLVLQMVRENLSSPLYLRSILNSNNSSLFLTTSVMTKYANFARVEGAGLQGNYLEI